MLAHFSVMSTSGTCLYIRTLQFKKPGIGTIASLTIVSNSVLRSARFSSILSSMGGNPKRSIGVLQGMLYLLITRNKISINFSWDRNPSYHSMNLGNIIYLFSNWHRTLLQVQSVHSLEYLDDYRPDK